MPAAPKKVWKGVRRRLINRLTTTLEQLEAMDTREVKRAQRFEIEPELFFETQALTTAAVRLRDQVDDLLTRIQ